jgi:hypothetical protein
MFVINRQIFAIRYSGRCVSSLCVHGSPCPCAAGADDKDDYPRGGARGAVGGREGANSIPRPGSRGVVVYLRDDEVPAAA